MIKVWILCGGDSLERGVSLASGKAVADACERLEFEIAVTDFVPFQFNIASSPFDVVFPVLHGGPGEDGRLQAILECHGVNFVGSGSVPSYRAMHKAVAKAIWRKLGLPTPDWAVLSADSGDLDIEQFGATGVCLKPESGGSSQGVQLLESAKELRERRRSFDGCMLIEQRLFGRELTVGILDGVPLPIVEIFPAKEFYDFESKYTCDQTKYVVPAALSDEQTSEIKDLALSAFQAIGCQHYGRVDLILDNDKGPSLLEINTIPGFAKTSLLPKAASAMGISFDHLVQQLIMLGTQERKLPVAAEPYNR